MVDVNRARLERRNGLIEHLAAMGMPLGEIASQMRLSVASVSRILRDPASVVRVEAINRRIRDRIVSNAADLGLTLDAEAHRAVETLRDLNLGLSDDMNNPVPHAVRLQAAVQILDRAPHAPARHAEKDSEKHLHIHLPVRQFENAQQAIADVGIKLETEEPPE